MSATRRSPLDQALDELYAATPPEFVLVRSRLERALRSTDPDAATDIGRRRRPNLAAWACNQLARRDAEGVAALVALTRRLAEAQQAVVNGHDADTFRDVTRQRRDLLDELAARAVAELQPWAPKPATYRDPVTATLDAASLDPDLVADLEAGRLTRALTSPAGLGPLPDTHGPAPVRQGARRVSKRERDAAQRELTDAQRAAKDQAAAADTAATEQASAEMHADATAAQLREVERAVERARSAARQAARDAEAARDRTKAARQLADQADQRVRRAEQHLRTLDGS